MAPSCAHEWGASWIACSRLLSYKDGYNAPSGHGGATWGWPLLPATEAHLWRRQRAPHPRPPAAQRLPLACRAPQVPSSTAAAAAGAAGTAAPAAAAAAMPNPHCPTHPQSHCPRQTGQQRQQERAAAAAPAAAVAAACPPSATAVAQQLLLVRLALIARCSGRRSKLKVRGGINCCAASSPAIKGADTCTHQLAPNANTTHQPACARRRRRRSCRRVHRPPPAAACAAESESCHSVRTKITRWEMQTPRLTICRTPHSTQLHKANTATSTMLQQAARSIAVRTNWCRPITAPTHLAASGPQVAQRCPRSPGLPLAPPPRPADGQSKNTDKLSGSSARVPTAQLHAHAHWHLAAGTPP